jgi:hypothetical protein
MDYELDNMMGFDKLGLYYDVHMEGIDGENFYYSVYFDDFTEDKLQETIKAIAEYTKPFEERDIYLGYVDVTMGDGKLDIYLDVGNTSPMYEDVAIKGILHALNTVSGIRSVIVNEDCDY